MLTRRVLLTLVTAALALALAGCTETGEEATSSSGDTGASGGQERGYDLVADPGISFQITFLWENPPRGRQGYFVWTQGNGRRRWDTVVLEGGEPLRGSISIEAAFSPGVNSGFPSLGCSWVTAAKLPEGQVLVFCGSGGRPELYFVSEALYALIDKSVQDQTVAGRNASCYSLAYPDYTTMVLCVDSSQGIPLLLATENVADTRFTVWMEAISISTAEQNLMIPFGLEGDPREGFPDYEGQVPISELLLPDLPELSAFEEKAE